MKKSLAILSCIWFCHCSQSDDQKEKLEIRTAAPITIAVGDTGDLIVVAKTSADATGRLAIVDPYTSFSLIVSDTAVAGIAQLHKLVGKTAGETTVIAADENSSLRSAAIKVTVTPAP